MSKQPIEALKDLIAGADAAQEITAEEAGRLYDFLERLEKPTLKMIEEAEIAGEHMASIYQRENFFKAAIRVAQEPTT